MFPHLKFVMFFWDNHICGKCHIIYESQPCSVIVTLGGQLYMVQEVAPTTATSLISENQCRNIIYQTTKFSLFMV
jgi:hypothetical protein